MLAVPDCLVGLNPHVDLRSQHQHFFAFTYKSKLTYIMPESIQELSEEQCYVALTYDHLDAKAIMDRVRSPKAGAIVLFAGMFSSPDKYLSIAPNRFQLGS